jgi:hypothetical protein
MKFGLKEPGPIQIYFKGENANNAADVGKKYPLPSIWLHIRYRMCILSSIPASLLHFTQGDINHVYIKRKIAGFDPSRGEGTC